LKVIQNDVAEKEQDASLQMQEDVLTEPDPQWLERWAFQIEFKPCTQN
jgi:hypothetical protein